jgi:starch-binding outer membrane protein, SusD/RagB family
MKTKKIILLTFIIALVVSCGKYLEPYPNGNYDSETMWQYQGLVQGLIGYCYDQINSNNRNYADNEGIYLDGATDDAVVTSSTNVMRRYAVNSMTTSQDPFATYWDRDYRAIRNCNLFLKDRRGYNTKYIINTTWNTLVKNRLQGEAFALRAYFEWDLLQKFGGMSNGVMLGFPIVTNVLNATDNINLGRNTYDDCVKQILADCDSAYKYLPIAHRDYLANSADLGYSGGKYWGRFDGITMRALKAMVYLTWASPRFNPTGSIARWDSAAANAKKVIDFKMTVDKTTSGNSFNPSTGVAWSNPNSPEIVFSTRYNGNNTTIEKLMYPGGFAGTAAIGATQELVDAFPMANGRPINDPLSGYNSATPYVGRDPRFYSIIFYNLAKANRNNDVSKPMYTFENWNAGPTVGKDAAGTKTDNNRTNYYVKKYVFMGWNNSDVPPTGTNHSKFIVRWANMMLTFAEAANKVVGPLDATKYGMSARTAIQYLRNRKTYDGANGVCPVAPPTVPTAAQDPTLINTAAAGADAFDALIRNERRIETCFEGQRFYDLRRWTTDANWTTVLNAPVHGAYITQVNATTYTYNLNYVVEERNFTSPYNPIPYSEILRMNRLVQNDGWANWN